MKAVYARDRRAKLLLDAETKSPTVPHISFLSSFCFISVLHLAFHFYAVIQPPWFLLDVRLRLSFVLIQFPTFQMHVVLVLC